MKNTLTILAVLISLGLQAQNNLTLYNMTTVPQQLQANPAHKLDCKWYLGMPALSSTDFNFNSNGLAMRKINNAFVPNGDGTFTFDVTKLSDVLDRNTFVNVGINQDWLNFGFRVGKNNLFTANITEKVKARVSIPGDFFKFVFEGNGGDNLGEEFKFNWGVDFLHTREYAIGYQRSLLDGHLRVGGKLKYVYGLTSINTAKNDLSLTTAEENFNWTVKADVQVNAASSYASLDSSGPTPDPAKLFFGSKNNGMGIDVGAALDIGDRFTLSASVIDLGFINWNENVLNVRSRNPGASFTFRGIDLKDYFSDSGSTAEGFEQLGDSLIDIFALDTTSITFSTGLIGEFFLGAKMHVNENNNAAALVYGSFYNKQFYPAITLSWNSKLGRVLGTNISYTAMRGNYANIGAGLSLNLGPEQFYFVSDNVIGSFTGNIKNLSFRFGWNHTFGRKKLAEE